MGDYDLLIERFSEDFDLVSAMDAAGYIGSGRIYEAVQDIKEHADILRDQVKRRDVAEMRQRILEEYESIAFDRENKAADRMRALEMCRILTEPDFTGASGDRASSAAAVPAVFVNYDYGDDEA